MHKPRKPTKPAPKVREPVTDARVETLVPDTEQDAPTKRVPSSKAEFPSLPRRPMFRDIE